MIQINQQVPPAHPDGWHFWEDDVRLQADTYRDLLKKVTDYRISQRREWQSVQSEINEYLAGISPNSVAPPDPAYQKQAKSLADHVYNWLSRTYNRLSASTAYASAPEANRRAAICSSCPHNVKAPNGCVLCVSQMQRMSAGLAKGRTTYKDRELRACDLLHYQLKTAVHLEVDLLGEKQDIEALPPKCWRKP